MSDDIKKPVMQPDGELLRNMIHLSNNSRMTNETAALLSNKLEKEDLNILKRWFQHAIRETQYKQIAARSKYGRL